MTKINRKRLSGRGLSIRANKSDDAGKAIAMTAPVSITASAEANGAKTPARFSMVAYTGGPMTLKGWKFPVVVDLQGMSGINKSRPALLDHKTNQIVGHTDSIKIDNGQLVATGVMSGAGASANEVLSSSTSGFPWQASIGANPIKVEFVPAGQRAQANGKTFEGPINIARKTVLGEISFVALGADDDTSARIAAEAAGESSMEFEQWLKAKGFVLGELSDQQKKSLQAAFDSEQATIKAAGDAEAAKKIAAKRSKKAKKLVAAGNVDGDEDRDGDDDDDDDQQIDAESVVKQIRAEAVTERKRIAAITKVCNKFRAKVPAEKFAEIEAKAIDEEWDSDKTELALIRAERPSPAAPMINTGGNVTAPMMNQAITASLAKSAGVSEKTAFLGLDDRTKEIAASRQLRGMGLHQVMFLIASANGINHTPGKVDDDFLRAMFMHERNHGIEAADGGGFSTMSLSGITENILNKAMLESYNSVTSVVSDIAYETDTNDFKTYKRYRLTGSGAMATVGPTGELKNMSLQDETYSNTLGTVGCIIPISRNLLVNDDMGALAQVPTVIGRQAAIAREAATFAALFANTSSFFGTGNKNYLSSASSVLSITSMASARQKFLEQKDANGDPIMVMPDRVLVPPPLETVADNLFSGAQIVVGALGATNAKTTEPNLNAHKGKYRPIVTPFLGAQQPASVGASGSDTAWYLLGNPAGGMAVLQVGYLRGQRTPVIERGEVNFNTLGMAMRGYFDFGVALLDSRCGVLSAGA